MEKISDSLASDSILTRNGRTNRRNHQKRECKETERKQQDRQAIRNIN